VEVCIFSCVVSTTTAQTCHAVSYIWPHPIAASNSTHKYPWRHHCAPPTPQWTPRDEIVRFPTLNRPQITLWLSDCARLHPQGSRLLFTDGPEQLWHAIHPFGLCQGPKPAPLLLTTALVSLSVSVSSLNQYCISIKRVMDTVKRRMNTSLKVKPHRPNH
jgi:hypothetical protein